MKRFVLLAAVCAPVIGLAQTPGPPGVMEAKEPPMLGIHWARGFEPAPRAKEEERLTPARLRRSPNMTYHGGVIMQSVTDAKAIFWGTSWPSYTGDKISGM